MGRSGRFGEVMVMSHGCDLNIHGHGLNFLDTHCSLPMFSLPGTMVDQHFLALVVPSAL